MKAQDTSELFFERHAHPGFCHLGDEGEGFNLMARAFTDHCIMLFMAGKLDSVTTAMAKTVPAELYCETADKCLQLFGGWGCMDARSLTGD